ncbi:MAG: hypothetical protein COB09_12365 [Thalassobium sp.]|nr:MAG: hypothetical protein COB09_12365 [Thalassobium sp.]
MELDLTSEEIIVLTGLLKRYSESGVFAIEDQAEQRALWNLECVLEKVVGNLYEGEWSEVLNSAQNSLRDETGTSAAFEKENGRIALWLEPIDIQFILSEWRKVSENEPESTKDNWGKLSFRCNSALYKAGLK